MLKGGGVSSEYRGIVRQFYHIIDVLVPCSGLQWDTRPPSEYFFLALPDGFVVKVLVANAILLLLYCVSYHGENAQIKARAAILWALPALSMIFFLLSRWKCSNQDTRSCEELRKRCFCEIKESDRFLSPLWIESGERAMRGAGPSEAPSTSVVFLCFLKKGLLKIKLNLGLSTRTKQRIMFMEYHWVFYKVRERWCFSIDDRRHKYSYTMWVDSGYGYWKHHDWY